MTYNVHIVKVNTVDEMSNFYKVTGNTQGRYQKIKKADWDGQAKYDPIEKAWYIRAGSGDSIMRYGDLNFTIVDSRSPACNAEQAYDKLHNEGFEGYNPHR